MPELAGSGQRTDIPYITVYIIFAGPSMNTPPPPVSNAVYTEHIITRQHTPRTIHLVRWTRRMSADVSTVPWRSPRSTVRRHERNASIAGEYLRAMPAMPSHRRRRS
jgi:hypothetical protein